MDLEENINGSSVAIQQLLTEVLILFWTKSSFFSAKSIFPAIYKVPGLLFNEAMSHRDACAALTAGTLVAHRKDWTTFTGKSGMPPPLTMAINFQCCQLLDDPSIQSPSKQLSSKTHQYNPLYVAKKILSFLF